MSTYIEARLGSFLRLTQPPADWQLDVDLDAPDASDGPKPTLKFPKLIRISQELALALEECFRVREGNDAKTVPSQRQLLAYWLAHAEGLHEYAPRFTSAEESQLELAS